MRLVQVWLSFLTVRGWQDPTLAGHLYLLLGLDVKTAGTLLDPLSTLGPL
jgi:hypothetical protein